MSGWSIFGGPVGYAPSERAGWVYFVRCVEAEAVKVGFTTQAPAARLRDLQTGCPYELELVLFFKSTVSYEWFVHKSWQDEHLRGDWFRESERITRWLEISIAHKGREVAAV